MPNESEFRDVLRSQMYSAVDRCVAPSDFGAHFLPHWFWEVSRAYCFVFKKNLRITNIQVAELFSLLRSHVHATVAESEIRLSSLPAFDKQLSRFMETFSLDAASVQDSLRGAVDKIAELYTDYFQNLVLIDLHFGSCIVSIPPLYSIDLESICYLSGYIHSCGPCIYARDIYHSRYGRFLDYLTSYLDRITDRGDLPILFRPYSHEDFTKHDRDQEDDLASGLDELKLYSTKQYVGDLVLAGMIEKLRQEGSLEGKLTFARPGSSRLDKRLEGKVDPNRTFWLILDRSIGRFDERHPPSLADSRHPGNRHTLICYDQTLLNQNPFHIFDENKPGWYDHTTIPHTLMGAMINLTRPYWSTGRVQRLCDPFAGSGTAWLESRKYVDVTFSGFDTEHLSQNVSNDNLVFFSQSLTCLQQIQASIKKAYENVVTPPHELDEVEEWNTSPEHAALDWANNLIDQIVKRSRHDEFVFDEGTVTELRRDDVTLLARLFFYTTLKGRRRFSAALGTGQISEKDVLAKELDRLNKQIKRYVGVRERLATKSVRTEGPRALFLEQYSSAISLNPEWLASSIGETPIAIRSITKMTEESAYDVIVTDPPYGFNTHEHVESLVEVYREGLANIIRALTSDGQLVIALPDWSHTGRRIPAFAFKEFVTYNLLQMARQQGREAYQASAHHPGFSVSTLPPYYWESERALRRAILHFRFRPLNNT